MVFVWVYVCVFPLDLWFFFWFMVFVWVYICVFFLGFCYSSIVSFGFMLLLCSSGFGYVICMFFQIWVQGYMKWKRKGALRTKGHGGVVAGKSISPYHRHSAWQRTESWRVNGVTGMMEMGCTTAVYRDAGVMEMGCAEGSLYSEDPAVDRSQLAWRSISSHLKLFYHIWISHSIVPSFCYHWLCPRSRGSLQPGSIIPSYPFSMFLHPELLFLTNSIWMRRDVRQSVDDGLSVYSLRHFSTLCAMECNLERPWEHVQACTWELPRRCTWEHTRFVHGSVLRAWLGAFSQAGSEWAIGCNLEHPWDHGQDCTWERNWMCT